MKMLAQSVNRDSRLDVARGLAIVAIVLVHVCRGLYSAGLLDLWVTATVDRVVGTWCLCVFAFVGGTFVPQGVRRRGTRAYLRDRVPRFFVIYVTWTLLQGGVMLLAASLVNVPTSVSALFMWWRPTSQLWYLPFLIMVTLVFVPMKPWEGRRGRWILGLAAVVSVLFWGYDGGYVGTQGLGLVVFFVAGLVIGGERVKQALDRFGPASAAAISIALLTISSIVVVATDGTVATVFWQDRTLWTVAVGFVFSIVASAAVLLFGQATRAVSVLAMLGRRSLDIYLAHIIMAAGTRIVLVQVGVTSTWVLAVCGLVVGVFGSVAAATLLRRIGFSWLFDGPAWLTGPKRPASAPSSEPRR